MVKRVLLLTVIIILGFMLGFILPKNISLKNASTPVNTTEETNTGDINADLIASALTIKSAGEEQDQSKIEKTALDISYKSDTSDLNKVKIVLFIKGGNKLMLHTFPGTQIDTEATKSNKITVVTGPDARRGETKSAGIYLASREKGEYTIKAQIQANGKVKQTNSVTIKVE